MAELSVGERLSGIDLSDWAGVEPGELLVDPSLVRRHPLVEAAARALRYARAAAGASYDELGFRLRAATPASAAGPVQLETFATARLRHGREMRRQAASEVERVRSEQHMLRHRAIDFHLSGHIRYETQGDLINLEVTADDGTREIWTYALSHLPEGLRRDDGYYAFISHRWLTPAHPDPEGRQAQFVAWQLVACLCEAIRVAQLRGLHRPRLQSTMGPGIGAQGSGLAESIIVNVLRPALDSNSLERAAAEAASIRELMRDHGVSAAAADPGLANLRAVLAEHPALAALLTRISVWYDYSCVPQPPRTDDEDVLFRQGIGALNACQILGITVVLLDDAEDYLTRAWCTLEGLTADAFGSIETLVGSERPTAADGTVEDWFEKLLQDRPHIVWRGLLDTEVFGVQDAQTCLERLSLAATDRDDLPFIYARLRTLPAPRKIHIDGSEIVTGTLPLPALDDGRVLAAGTGRAVRETRSGPVASLDWTNALVLGGTEPTRRRIIASWSPRASHGQGQRDARAGPGHRRRAEARAAAAHLAVVAACEGEAVLVADWVETHLPELETMLGLSVVSMSWTASDIASVGHLAEGTLQLMAVEAPVWVLATVRVRFQHDPLTSAIANAVTASGRPLVRVVLDERENNVEGVSPPGEDDREARTAREELVAVDPGAFGTRVGGLYRSTLADVLSGRRNPDGRT